MALNFLSAPPYACMLAGSDGRLLFICTAESAVPEDCRARATGCIETITVDVSRAEFP